MLLVLGGCPKHENLPTSLELETAPAPSNFVVTALGVNSSGTFDYDLTWTVSDPAAVDRFRLYLVGGGFVPELVYETNATETSDLTISLTLPSNAEGLQFGLSTVSTGSVESAMVVAFIPPVP
jgi:hypothetical protein